MQLKSKCKLQTKTTSWKLSAAKNVQNVELIQTAAHTNLLRTTVESSNFKIPM
jgi:hypothetical protein